VSTGPLARISRAAEDESRPPPSPGGAFSRAVEWAGMQDQSVYRFVHQIRPLPECRYFGGLETATVRSYVRASDQDAAIEHAEQFIRRDGWAIVALLDSGLVNHPSGYSATTARDQGHCFNFDLTGISKKFVEEHGIGEDY
jgi:hypothetical protein